MGHLPADRIQAVFTAAITTGLAGQNDALVAGLPPSYTATLPSSGPPAARLLQTLHALNDVPVLADGTVPLAIWLRNASMLAAERSEAGVFQRAASEIRKDAERRAACGAKDGGAQGENEAPESVVTPSSLLCNGRYMYLNERDIRYLARRLGVPETARCTAGVVRDLVSLVRRQPLRIGDSGELCLFRGAFGLLDSDSTHIALRSTDGVVVSMGKVHCCDEIASGGQTSHFHVQTRAGTLTMEVLGTRAAESYLKPHAVAIDNEYWAPRYNALTGEESD